MERQILFHGKRPNSGKWIEGFLYRENELSWILSERFRSPECSCEVLTESVGQFTGLSDKNGNKLFEGDIVKEMDRDNSIMNEWKEINRDVVNLDRFGFWLKNESFGYEGEELQDSEYYEIIGNIHDNPELLKL